MDDLTTEQIFDSLAAWHIDVLGLFFLHLIRGCLYDQTHPDVQSTDSGNKYLYCTTKTGFESHVTWVINVLDLFF